jgi:hypothetical protein
MKDHSGQWRVAWSKLARAIFVMVWISLSATPFWWWAPTPLKYNDCPRPLQGEQNSAELKTQLSVALNGNTNIRSLMFKEQFATYGITGSSSKLVIDEEEGTAMVHIDCSTRVTISRGAMPRGRGPNLGWEKWNGRSWHNHQGGHDSLWEAFGQEVANVQNELWGTTG